MEDLLTFIIGGFLSGQRFSKFSLRNFGLVQVVAHCFQVRDFLLDSVDLMAQLRKVPIDSSTIL